VTLPMPMGKTFWLTQKDYQLPSTLHDGALFCFEAKAENDIILLLDHQASAATITGGRHSAHAPPPAYEINIGGWLNTKTAIRKLGNLSAMVSSHRDPNAAIDDPHVFAPYYLLVTRQSITVGKGRDPYDKNSRMLRYRSRNLLLPIKYIGLSGWHGTVQYRALSVRQVDRSRIRMLSRESIRHRRNLKFFYSEMPMFTDVELISESGSIFRVHATVLFSWMNTHSLADVKLPPENIEYCTRDSSSSASASASSSSAASASQSSFSRYSIASSPATSSSGLRPTVPSTGTLLKIHLPYENGVLYQLCMILYTGRAGNRTSTLEEKLLEVANMFQMSSIVSRIQQRSRSGDPVDQVEEKLLVDFSWLAEHDPYSDIVVCVKEKQFPANRLLLSLHSDVFFAMLSGGMRESTQRYITLQDISTVALRGFIAYTYTNSISETDVDTLLELLVFADQYGLRQSFLNDLLAKLKRLISIDNCCECLQVADLYNFLSFRECCIQWMQAHFGSVIKLSGFVDLPPALLSEMLMSDQLLVSLESKVYEAVVRWVYGGEPPNSETGMAALEKRFVFFERLLSTVRFSYIEREYLESIILPSALYQKSSVLRAMVSETIEFFDSILDFHQFKNLSADGLVTPLHPPRAVKGMIELPYTQQGVDSGVFHYLGTVQNREAWTNPHKSGIVEVFCSAPTSRYTLPECFIDPAFRSTSFVTGWPAWIAVDLGQGTSLFCDYYTIRHDSSPGYLRSWTLQGCNPGDEWTRKKDGNPAEELWEDVSVHENDETLEILGAVGGWPVSSPHSECYRLFRLKMTGKNSDGNKYTMCLSSFELYGYLKCGKERKD